MALTLRLLGGLTTDEVARAFLVPEPTVAQRIVRAKKALARAQVPFEVPDGGERAARLGSVLEVVYLVINEGYSATAGEDWVRPALWEEALRLGRVLAGLAPDDAEVHGLVALMEIQASRTRARTERRCCCSTRTARAGTGCSSRAASRRWTAPRPSPDPRALRVAGHHRRLPCPRRDAGGDRLGADRRLARNGAERELLAARAAPCAERRV